MSWDLVHDDYKIHPGGTPVIQLFHRFARARADQLIGNMTGLAQTILPLETVLVKCILVLDLRRKDRVSLRLS